VTWAVYSSFLVVAAVLVLVPGPDFAVVTKNTLSARDVDHDQAGLEHAGGEPTPGGPNRPGRPGRSGE
jgi:hypothetical protein